MGDLKESFVRFLSGNFTERDFLIVKNFLIKEAERLISVYSLEEDKEEVVSEFIKHILEKAYYFQELANTGRLSIGYIRTSFRNFIIDIVRTKLITVSIDEGIEKHGSSFEKKLLERNLVELEERIELLEFAEKFALMFEEEEIKILCYLYDRSYKCFWRNKTETALYKHVSRNKRKVIEKLRELSHVLKTSPEILEKFLLIYLSKECEKLRSIYCKEDTENGTSSETP